VAKVYLKALGIMNGTSVDAVDYCLIQIHRQNLKAKFLGHRQKNIPPKLKEKILLAASNQMTTFEVSDLNFELGRLYSKQVASLKKDWKWDVIGLHGQTVHHSGRKATLQIGTPAFLQASNQSPVVSDFRSIDVASGGEGAPFAPFFQKSLLGNPKTPLAFHNLGGISNLTWFHKAKVRAFDSGPANILLDGRIQELTKGKVLYDKNGQVAATGLPEPKALEALLKHPYFRKKAPKSCGREEFNSGYLKAYCPKNFSKLPPQDQLATLTELTAITVAKAYGPKFIEKTPDKIYFYGGGVFNKYLMSRIQYHLPKTEIETTDALGWPTQGFEGAVFAYLAGCRILQKTVHLPQVTGARKAQALGVVYL